MIDYVTGRTLNRKTDEWLQAIAPFNQHDWELEPHESALLVIDCQNHFVGDPEPRGAPILPRITSLIEVFREAKRPVIFTRHLHKADGSDLGLIGQWWEQNIIEGTPEGELHLKLEVGPDDIVIRKNRYSAFVGTQLDRRLRRMGVGDLVITGVMTNLCCETTARDGFCRDFRVFFVADATGTTCEEMHVASLMNVAFGFGVVMKTSDVLAAFGSPVGAK